MNDVNEDYEIFLIAEYIIYWVSTYLERIVQRIHEDE